MPHIPGHLTPFSQSLINQGMNETNRIAGNATNPPNMINQPYTTFSNNNNMNPGGGNVMGGPGFGPGSGSMGTYDSGHGEGAAQSGAGISGGMQFDQGLGLGSGSAGGGHLGFGGSMGGDTYDEWLAEQAQQEWLASDEYQEGVVQNPDGTYSIDNQESLYGDVWEQSGLLTSNFNSPQQALDAIASLQSLQELNEQGFYDTDIAPPGSWDLNLGGSNLGGAFDFGFGGMTDQVGQNLQNYQSGFDLNNDGIVDIFDMQAIDQNNMGSQEYIDFLTSMQNYIQGDIGEGSNPLDDAFQQTLIDAQQEAPTYTGGSMQATPLASGARLAKRLYYPGTTGGFSGVGSGIGGGNNTLQQLLKGMG